MEATVAKAQPVFVSYSKIRVSVVDGPEKGTARELVSNTLRIGTASDNDLVLNDGTVSRHHCALVPVPGGVRVQDEGSTNGIFVGNLRVANVVATEPIEIQLGNTRIRIEPLAEKVSREQLNSESFGDLLGRSACMRELFADLARIAPSDVTVLIEGETGTGKELVADALHRASKRANRPYVTFDCSAVVSTLIESELFGTVPGAFNGAVNRKGYFEQAHGGTIFIDELGELPKDLQPKLLRVLERREVRRLGSEQTKPIDVRVISATNRNLEAEVQRGNFREDLYYRLATAHVRVPPLRDRMDDVPMLMAHFLKRAQAERSIADLPKSVLEMFFEHRWPGNVRELWNAVQRMLITPDRVFLQSSAKSPPSSEPNPASNAEPLPLRNDEPLPPLRIARRDANDAFERDYIEKLMARTDGSRKAAAAMADVSREMIRKILVKHGLEG